MRKLAKTGKFIKKNLTSLIFFMILLVVVLITILVVSVLLPTTNTSQYGERLDGIDKVVVSNSEKSKITNELKANAIVSDAKVSISGRIINIEIELNSTGTIVTGKELGALIITKFETDEQAYYDFQVFLTSTGPEGHTVIGYKTPKAEALSWTNN